MLVETYSEIFRSAAFPVFAINENCSVIYKNAACTKHLSFICRGRTVNSKTLFKDSWENGVAHIADKKYDSYALALTDESVTVFLCFLRFQYADGKELAEQFIKIFGKDLLNFLTKFGSMLTVPGLSGCKPDLSAERLMSLVRKEIPLEGQKIQQLFPIMEQLFQLLPKNLEPLGYQISAKIKENFPKYLSVGISANGFLFVFEKLLYLMMKYSQTKKIDIDLFPEIAYPHHTLRLATKTNLKELPQTSENNVRLLETLIPECASELALLNAWGLLGHSDFTVYIDAFGTLSIEYKFAYAEPHWGVLRSVDCFHLPTSEDMEAMIRRIEERLKGMCASC